jgi:hypothetical protein
VVFGQGQSKRIMGDISDQFEPGSGLMVFAKNGAQPCKKDPKVHVVS